MNLRFQSKVSGNCTFTSPISTIWVRESLKEDCSANDSRCSAIGGGDICSRLFGDNEVKRLRRDPPARLDMRFISRLALDSFGLSSATEEESLGDNGRLPEDFL